MKEGKGKILVVILTIMVIVFGGLNVYQYLDKKDDSNNDNYLTLVEGHQVKVENKNAKLLEKNEYYALYSDNGLMMYDIKTKESTRIDIGIENIQETNYFLTSNGMVYDDYKNNNNGFYNFKKASIVLKNKYEDMHPIYDAAGLETNYLIARNNEKVYVIDSETEKIIINEIDSNWPCYDCYTRNVRIEYSGDIVFVTFWSSEGTGGGYSEYGYTIYNSDGEVLAKLADDEYYSFNNWNELTIYKEKK